MIIEQIKPTGKLLITLLDSLGNIKNQVDVLNLVVTSGKEYISSRISNNDTAVMSHMSVGTNTTTTVAASRALGTEITNGRVRLGVVGGVLLGSDVTYTATFAAGIGTGAITEAGIFNAVDVGMMLCRTTFAVINKEAADSLVIVWKVTVN